MIKGEGGQLINFDYILSLNSEELNRYFYNIFTPGILDLDISYTTNTITINQLSFFITPNNKTTLLLKVDTLTPYIIETYNDNTKNRLIARYNWKLPNEINSTDTDYDYDNINFFDILLIEKENIEEYDITIADIDFNDFNIHNLNYTNQSKVFLKENCINYDKYENNNWALENSNVSGVFDPNSNYHDLKIITTGNSGYSGYIPIANGILNENLNAEFLNGISAGNESGKIAIKNKILNTNLKTKKLFKDNIWYEIGNSGIGYSGYSNYSGYSFYSGYSGNFDYTIPINNNILTKNLNVEFLQGYSGYNFSEASHIHKLDSLTDSIDYQKILNVDDNLATTNSIMENAFEYKHQDTSFRFHKEEGDSGISKKIYMIYGYTINKTVLFKYEFKDEPTIILTNNNSFDFNMNGDYKSVYDITTTGFKINHEYNSINNSGLSKDDNNFFCNWIAIGELKDS